MSSTNMEEAGFTTYTAASHQVAIKMIHDVQSLSTVYGIES